MKNPPFARMIPPKDIMHHRKETVDAIVEILEKFRDTSFNKQQNITRKALILGIKTSQEKPLSLQAQDKIREFCKDLPEDVATTIHFYTNTLNLFQPSSIQCAMDR